jgi:hypothetical protein
MDPTGCRHHSIGALREADLDKVEVPEGFEVLDAEALARRLGLRRQTVQAYISRGWYHLIPRPNRVLKVGPIWYVSAVRSWENNKKESKSGE